MSKNILLLFRLFVFLNCVFQIFGQTSYDLPGKLRKLQFCFISSRLNNFFILLLAGWFGEGVQHYDIGVDYATFHEKAVRKFLNFCYSKSIKKKPVLKFSC